MLALFILIALSNGVQERAANALNAAAVWFVVHDALGCTTPPMKPGVRAVTATVRAEQQSALEMLASKLETMSHGDPTFGVRAAQWIRDHT